MLNEMKSFDSNPATWADMMGRLVDGQNPKPYEKNEWTLPKVKKLILSVDTNKPYVVCHLGASNKLKFWSPESWQKLMNELKRKGLE